MEQAFRSPPPECRPEVFWDWMGGLVSKEGITKDLEALARAGRRRRDDHADARPIGRHASSGGSATIPGKVKCLSDEWFAMMNHAAKETDRLGLRMSFLMCPGWSHCGGPWIKPDKGLKILVASRTPVAGPAASTRVLPRAPIHKPTGRIATLAGQSPTRTSGTGCRIRARISTATWPVVRRARGRGRAGRFRWRKSSI